MSSVTPEQLQQLAPNAHTSYKRRSKPPRQSSTGMAFTSGLRLAHVMAQALHETSGLTILGQGARNVLKEALSAPQPRQHPVGVHDHEHALDTYSTQELTED